MLTSHHTLIAGPETLRASNTTSLVSRAAAVARQGQPHPAGRQYYPTSAATVIAAQMRGGDAAMPLVPDWEMSTSGVDDSMRCYADNATGIG
jgi:hypothetical protein